MCGILVLSGVITAVLPKSAKGEPETPAATAEPSSTRLVAPVPYGGAGESSAAAPALNWGTVGPQRQTADGGYTYTALPQKAGPPCRSSAGWIPAGLRTLHFWAIR